MEKSTLILSSLIRNSEYKQKVLPYLKAEYFQDSFERKIFETLQNYFSKFKTSPTKTELFVEFENYEGYEDQIKQLWDVEIPSETQWAVDKTEEFCKHQAIYNAIMKSIAIYDGSDKKNSAANIPILLKEAVGVNFNSNIGLDFYNDVEKRLEYYSGIENKIPFLIGSLNEITNGGLTTKTLNILVAGTNVGKSLTLISLAADYIRQGIDVLYITMEMREEEIFRRFDANLMDMRIKDISALDKKKFINNIDQMKAKSYGTLKVKEFPPGSANSIHFEHLMNELDNKKNFKPKVLIVDYLGIIDSSRIRVGTQQSYFLLKAASEELRALAVEKDIICLTAMQLNRGGMNSSDFELSDISESMGVTHTADFMLGLIRTEELDKENQILAKQLKNRYANKATSLRFVLGVDLEKQYVFDSGMSVKNDVDDDKMKMVANSSSVRNKFKVLEGENNED